MRERELEGQAGSPGGGEPGRGEHEIPLRRIRLTVAYDGTNYNGWQYQPNGTTIEEVLNGAISDLTGERIRIAGASRTDAGVHALCNYAAFDTRMRMPAPKFAYALNQRLPEDIRIRRSEEVRAGWHPRNCRSIKTYEYRILNEEFPNPLERLYAHFTYVPLDAERMREAAGYLCGTHDFCAFSSLNPKRFKKSTVRRLDEVRIEQEGSMIRIYFTGNGFLYHMVRILAGTLVEVGMGLKKPEDVEQMLASGSRADTGRLMPPEGLTLLCVEYQ